VISSVPIFCGPCLNACAIAQSLMTPYLSFLLSPFIESLQVSSDSDEEDSLGAAQLCIVRTLTKSMNVDEGGSYPPNPPRPRLFSDTPFLSFSQTPAFWRDDRLQQLMPVLVALIPHAGTATNAADQDGNSRDIVSAGLVALCDAATDDTLLKRLSLDVLMHTRADDDARVRIFALQCARALWTAHGGKLIGKRDWPTDPFFCHLADNVMRLRFRVGDGDVYRRMRRGRARWCHLGDPRAQSGRRGRDGREHYRCGVIKKFDTLFLI
jgi:hypothetical protein